MCGEYGEDFSRPHYHACLFNFDFRDKLYFKRSGDSKLYTSSVLSELWPFGFSLIGALTFESAAYTARYCMKKVTGKGAEDHYKAIDTKTGEIYTRVAEFNKMSLRPGIGAPWFEKFSSDVYPEGKVVVRGKKATAPRFYDKLYERIDSDDNLAHLRYLRELSGKKNFEDNTPERLAVKEQIAVARLAQLNRPL